MAHLKQMMTARMMRAYRMVVSVVPFLVVMVGRHEITSPSRGCPEKHVGGQRNDTWPHAQARELGLS